MKSKCYKLGAGLFPNVSLGVTENKQKEIPGQGGEIFDK